MIDYAEHIDPIDIHSKEAEHFFFYGRVRKIVKSVDAYSCVFEKNNHIYIALSSGQVINAEKFALISDKAAATWLKLLLNIRGVTGTPENKIRRRMTL